jgi:hypothetical protein
MKVRELKAVLAEANDDAEVIIEKQTTYTEGRSKTLRRLRINTSGPMATAAEIQVATRNNPPASRRTHRDE